MLSCSLRVIGNRPSFFGTPSLSGNPEKALSPIRPGIADRVPGIAVPRRLTFQSSAASGAARSLPLRSRSSDLAAQRRRLAGNRLPGFFAFSHGVFSARTFVFYQGQ